MPSEYGGSEAGVVIDNGAPLKMSPSANGLLWTVEGNKPSKDYYYVVMNEVGTVVQTEKDAFLLSRKWSGNGSETYNQVFGRKYDKAGDMLKTIPRVYPASRAYLKYSKLFQEGEVPVLRVILNDADYNTFITDDGSNREIEAFGTLDFITPEDVFQFTNITLSLGGMGSRGQKKRPFKINLSEGEADSKENKEIYNRSSFKLRSCVYDESFIKNKMAVDIATSMGLPAGQASHARLYINNDPFGFYEISENLKKKFVRTYLHPGEKKSDITLGSYYKGVSLQLDEDVVYQAYLYPEPKEHYSEMYKPTIVREGAVNELDDITEIINWINGLTDKTSEKDIRAKFDVDMFLKYMTLEYLIHQWDGYLLGGNNYYIYRKVDGKFSLMSFDFDLTFGKWNYHEAETDFHNFAISTKNYGYEKPIRSQLYEKILKREPFKSQLKKIIDEVVSKLYNVEALKPRVLYFKEFLNDDILWETNVRPTLKTMLFEGSDQVDDLKYETSMSVFDGEKAADGEPSILSWVKAVSEFIAKTDGISLKPNFDNGEVGGVVETDENGDTKVNGVISASNTLIVNTISLIIIALLTILI